MSKPQSAGFKDFFPLATREAKNKAKERQKSKSKTVDSPSSQPSASDHDASILKARDLNAQSVDGGSGVITESATLDGSVPDGAALVAEDNESVQGDLLNGVGSASSNTSTISSVFSAPPATSTFGGSNNASSLTPLTTADSSPPGQEPSPRYPNTNTLNMISRDQSVDKLSSSRAVTSTPPQSTEQIPLPARIHLRDPNKGVKGNKCTYDPQLDPKLSSSDKKKTKPIYKVFGLVCTHSAGSVILFVKIVLANNLFRKMTLPQQTLVWPSSVAD